MSNNTNKANKQALENLHQALAETLKVSVDQVKQALENGEEPKGAAATLNVVRQFLKDNGIEGLPTDDNPLGALKDSLPFHGDDEEDHLGQPRSRH